MLLKESLGKEAHFQNTIIDLNQNFVESPLKGNERGMDDLRQNNKKTFLLLLFHIFFYYNGNQVERG